MPKWLLPLLQLFWGITTGSNGASEQAAALWNWQGWKMCLIRITEPDINI
jgi:hypothetical protein